MIFNGWFWGVPQHHRRPPCGRMNKNNYQLQTDVKTSVPICDVRSRVQYCKSIVPYHFEKRFNHFFTTLWPLNSCDSLTPLKSLVPLSFIVPISQNHDGTRFTLHFPFSGRKRLCPHSRFESEVFNCHDQTFSGHAAVPQHVVCVTFRQTINTFYQFSQNSKFVMQHMQKMIARQQIWFDNPRLHNHTCHKKTSMNVMQGKMPN